jgi:hypothetical protein
MRSFVTCALHHILEFRSWKMRWAGYVVCMVEMRNAYKTFVEEPIGKRPFG